MIYSHPTITFPLSTHRPPWVTKCSWDSLPTLQDISAAVSNHKGKTSNTLSFCRLVGWSFNRWTFVLVLLQSSCIAFHPLLGVPGSWLFIGTHIFTQLEGMKPVFNHGAWSNLANKHHKLWSFLFIFQTCMPSLGRPPPSCRRWKGSSLTCRTGWLCYRYASICIFTRKYNLYIADKRWLGLHPAVREGKHGQTAGALDGCQWEDEEQQ